LGRDDLAVDSFLAGWLCLAASFFVFDNFARTAAPIFTESTLYHAAARARFLIGEQLFAYLGYSCRFGYTYESLLRKSLSIKPHLAATVHNPSWGAISPVEGTLIKVKKGQEWKEVVRTALGVAPWVVALPGVSEGLREELKNNSIWRLKRQPVTRSYSRAF
jgi:hypothetical protein